MSSADSGAGVLGLISSLPVGGVELSAFLYTDISYFWEAVSRWRIPSSLKHAVHRAR